MDYLSRHPLSHLCFKNVGNSLYHCCIASKETFLKMKVKIIDIFANQSKCNSCPHISFFFSKKNLEINGIDTVTKEKFLTC